MTDSIAATKILVDTNAEFPARGKLNGSIAVGRTGLC
jgi:hypothetical protein